MSMSFAVVVCSYDLMRVNDLDESIGSIRCQTYRGPIEVIVCVDGNSELHDLLTRRYENVPGVKVIGTGKPMPLGLSYARNLGIIASQQDIVCFLDDDAVADPDWVAELAMSYERHDTPMVVGKILPLWRDKPPRWFTPAFYWLVGATGSLFVEQEHRVRNGFGSNLSCTRRGLDRIGLFASSLDTRGSVPLQAADAELGLRVREAFGSGPIYNPKAVVFHKVGARLRIQTLLKRAYLQGKCKGVLFAMHGRRSSSLDTEANYLRSGILREAINAARQLLRLTDVTPSIQTLLFCACISFAVMLGFLLQVPIPVPQTGKGYA